MTARNIALAETLGHQPRPLVEALQEAIAKAEEIRRQFK